MREFNKKTLQEALGQLPVHHPGAGLWDRVSHDLDAVHQQEKLQEALSQLPEHQPGPHVWNRIANQLERGNRRPLIRRIYQLSAAAAAVLLIGLAGYWMNQRSQPVVSVSYSTAIATDWPSEGWQTDPDDEAAVQEVVVMFVSNPVARQSGAYDLLQAELEELNQARSELIDMMETYGRDEAIIMQLKEVEIARSEVVKRMARYI